MALQPRARRHMPRLCAAAAPRWRGFSLRRFSLAAAYDRKAQDEGFLPDSCQVRCLSRLEELRRALAAAGPPQKSGGGARAPRGLYVYGGVGTGKTMMLDLFHQEVSAGGISCQRQHFHEFLQAVHTRLHKLRGRVGAQRNLLGLCAQEYHGEFPVLAFDEAHVLNVGDALMLRSFFEAYFEAGGVLVATSNVAPDDLYSSGINREVFLPFLDALRDRCDFFEMRGRHDYRGRAAAAGRLRGAFLWREDEVPSAPVAPDSFPELRTALALPGGRSFLPVAVDVDVGFGRTLRCENAWLCDGAGRPPGGGASGSRCRVVQFGFDELCRTATGPSEWVGLAEYADAIIVSGVPRFAIHDEDAARRFITFVDIVYDKQRFLVVTADVGPERIFSELIEKYGGDSASMAPTARTPPREPSGKHADADSKMKMPGHGLASGRHGVVFQRPKQLNYSASGGYVTSALEGSEDPSGPAAKAVSVTRTGGRAEHGAGSKERVMQGVVEEDSDWVEWSATGLKDASLFDLSPTNTHVQVTDKLLPFRRCASRLAQMRAGRA